MPRELDASKLTQFKVNPKSRDKPEPKLPQPKKPAEKESWPSREPDIHGSFTIRAPLDVIEDFKRMCKDDRRTYADMLSILMDNFSKSQS